MWPFSSSSSSQQHDVPAGGPSSGPQAQQAAGGAAAAAQDPSSPTAYFSSDAPRFDHSHEQAAQASAAATDPASPSYTPSTSELFAAPGFDYNRLHPLAGLGKDDLEYLDIVDASPSTLEGGRTALPSRGWSDDLCYGTGTTYLSGASRGELGAGRAVQAPAREQTTDAVFRLSFSVTSLSLGLAIGGFLGAREGLVRPLGVQSPTFRLRLNAVLNQVTRRGSFLGNSGGVLALVYNIIDASIDAGRGKHDMAGSIAAGGLSGALFKCTAGVRPMAISSGIMMALAATWTTAKQALV